MDQIHWSNLLVKSAGQMQPILGPPLVSLGARMAMPSNGPKTGKDGRETGKEKPHAATRGAWLVGVIALRPLSRMRSLLHRIRFRDGRKFARFRIVGRRQRKRVRESIFLYLGVLLPLCANRIGFRRDRPNTVRPFQWVVSSVRWLVVGVAVLLERDLAFNVIGKRSGAHAITSCQACVSIPQRIVRYLRQGFLVFYDIAVQERFNAV